MDTPFLTTARQDALTTLLAPERAREQPALMNPGCPEASAAIGSLALGGAERIVLDWAAGCAARCRVQLIVLRDVPDEWPLPPGVRVVRLGGVDLAHRLEAAGAEIAANGNPVVLCHLLTAAERGALVRGGAHPVPVLHNAEAGWLESAEGLAGTSHVIAVSRDAARALAAAGVRANCTVIHHVPRSPVARGEARREWRERWALPQDALVIGMIGGVKPQKAYPRALRVLAALLGRRDTYLVIVGGPVGRDGLLAWRATLAQAHWLDLTPRVRLTGFVRGASDCLPAFDVLLNTSRYEGLSIASLEALAAGLPVVASKVGGQGELSAPGLALVSFDAPDAEWADAVEVALERRPALPAWRDAPAPRLWTLFHLLRPFKPGASVLFVTANLNAGGAQRSLCNLAAGLNGSLPFEIAVCGDSSTDHFYCGLRQSGVTVHRSAASRDCFDHAEAILQHVQAGRFGTVCFWNVDPKVKLLLAKTLATTGVRLIDVSPGGYSFEEMAATGAFQEWIAFSQEAYYARLDRLVLKYRGSAPPSMLGRIVVIPNGVPLPDRPPSPADPVVPRIVMSGRIAPTKFVKEAVVAMRLLWRVHPRAELHLFGTSERRYTGYARELLDMMGPDLGERLFLHGAVFDAPERLAGFTAALVLGEHQGSPNAVLEALAAGLPVVANDSGGTRELVLDGRTGLLLSGHEPREIAAALGRVISDAALARRLAEAGRWHVKCRFSMPRMTAAYRKLLTSH